MKYYETTLDEYIQSKKIYNIHPEINDKLNKLPKDVNKLNNIILFGSSGTGKYSIALDIINHYSTNELKYDKKTTVYTDKINFNIKMSDIHYEVDLSLLGVNSKLLWHEIFFKIVDIISIKKDKFGIILCKNFHSIHSELLDIFYSYMQQYNHSQANIKIIFVIITEQISFIPFQITQTSQIINIKKPNKDIQSKYIETLPLKDNSKKNKEDFFKYIQHIPRNVKQKKNKNNLIKNIDSNSIINMKELNSFHLIEKTNQELPVDNFNIICDKIIREINNNKKICFTDFRDHLYDILTYGLDINECIWYIISYFITNRQLENQNISDLLIDCYSFFKYYNNNYRPIYHLENIFYNLIRKINNFNEHG